MGVLDDYFTRYQERVRSDFERLQASIRDRDVKGGANEQIVARFVEAHIPTSYIATNAQMIDAFGGASDELDVCACNVEQPLMGKDEHLLIVEGVDFAIQVKAKLTSTEIERMVVNCARAKRLRRTGAKGQVAFGRLQDVPHYFDRVPYVGFAFSSELTLKTAVDRLGVLAKAQPPELQPDALFVLGRGFVLNFRDGKGAVWTKGGKPMKGLVAVESDAALVYFVRFLIQLPRIQHVSRPLGFYFGNKLPEGSTAYGYDLGL